MSGKGSAPRPYSVDRETFAANWERVFGKGARPTVPADLVGPSIDGNAAASNSAQAGSSPAAPAIYVDNATGN